ncbi:putative orn/Lys/Arg decarboxylase [Mycobacterium xenopi 4042]|uniref:Putative orn/Lys/Arg decarboxylase n=1 Tax=Mycobacterium xenopi 4042 TaxID=1299334 RepID=X8BFV5_MYCXE|nr:putative orn/Lys/Arg decarboxylase [Mycobacterium xenopi 4042]
MADYHRNDRYGFSPPGHRQGRGPTSGCWPCWVEIRSAPTCWPAVAWTTGVPAAGISRRPKS